MELDHSGGPRQTNQVGKVALAVGFLALAAAVVVARWSPATGYELSIYAGTPAAYWLGVGVATAVGLWVALAADGRVRDAAHLLATLALVSVVALPLLRGYHFYGVGDALTHLGWASEIDAGTLNPVENLYPGIHLTASFLHELAGVELARALVALPVLVFPLAFVTFVALCVAFVSRRPWAATVGLFTALLFVPVNQVSVHAEPHPSSQAILFVPVVLYLLFRFLTAPADRRGLASAASVAFAVAAGALVFFHPQEMLNLLALLAAVAVVQIVVASAPADRGAGRSGGRGIASRLRGAVAGSGDGAIASHQSVHAHVGLLGVVFLLWTFRHERARERASFVLESLVAGGSTLEGTGGRVASLEALGGSVEGIFLKLFGVTLVLGIVALVVLYRHVGAEGTPSSPRRRGLVTYLGAGLVPLAALFGLVFLARQGDHYFRFFGFAMVPVTILAAVGLAGGAAWLGARTSGWHVVAALCVAFALMIPAQAAVYHKSPYMYQENKQVTEATIEGHASAFEYREADVVFTSLRSGPFRFVDAVYGRERAQQSLSFAGYRSGVPGEIFNTNLTTAYADDRYLAIHESTYRREAELLGGLRYARAGFDRLATDPRVDHVHTTGEFDLYRLEGTGS